MKRHDYILMSAAMYLQGLAASVTAIERGSAERSSFNMAEAMADEAEKRGYLEKD